MSKVITAREAEELVSRGEQPPAGSILTPSARDVFGGGSLKSSFKGSTARPGSGAPIRKSTEPSVPDYEFKWTTGSDPKTPAEIEKFFRSPAIEALKQRMSDMGDRLWLMD